MFSQGNGVLLGGHTLSRCEWGLKTVLFPEPDVHSGLAHIYCGKSLEEEDVEALTLGYSTRLHWPPDSHPPACAVAVVTFILP